MVNVTVGIEPTVPALSVFGWIIFMDRPGFNFDWGLPWADYRNGFGSAGSDFWLGLERLHLMTNSGNYRLRVEVLWRDNRTWSSAEYWSFVVGPEVNEQYRLSVDG